MKSQKIPGKSNPPLKSVYFKSLLNEIKFLPLVLFYLMSLYLVSFCLVSF